MLKNKENEKPCSTCLKNPFLHGTPDLSLIGVYLEGVSKIKHPWIIKFVKTKVGIRWVAGFYLLTTSTKEEEKLYYLPIKKFNSCVPRSDIFVFLDRLSYTVFTSTYFQLATILEWKKTEGLYHINFWCENGGRKFKVII